MLNSTDMKKILDNASKKIPNYGMELFEKGRHTVDKHFAIIQKGMGSDLKDKKFLYYTGEVEGLFTKKFKYAILFSADTFYFFDSSQYSNNIAARYSDIAKVTRKSIYLTVTLKDGTKFKSTCYRAEDIAILLNEVVKYIEPEVAVAPEPATGKKPKKATVKKAAEPKANEKPVKVDAPKTTAKKTPTKKVETVAESTPAPKKKVAPKVEAKSVAPVKKAPALKVEKPATVGDNHMTRLRKLYLLPKLGEVVPVPLQDTSKIKHVVSKGKINGSSGRRKDLIYLAGYVNGARGVAFINFSALTVRDDTSIRNKCRDLGMIYRLLPGEDICDILESTGKDQYFEKFSSGKFMLLFNNLETYTDLVVFIKGLRLEENIIACEFEGEMISVDDALELHHSLDRERAIADINLDPDEKFSVLVVSNIFKPEDRLEYSDRFYNFNTGKVIRPTASLPDLVLDGADAYDALVTATMYTRNGYEVLVQNSTGRSIFNMTDAVKTDTVDLPSTDKRVQVIYQGTLKNAASDGDGSELAIEVDPYNKVSVIRVIKEFMGWSLLEAKTFIDSCPTTLKVDKDPREIDEFIDAFAKLDCKVTLTKENYLAPIYEPDSKKVCGYTLINAKSKFFGESLEYTRSVNGKYGYTNQTGVMDFWLLDSGAEKIEVIKWVKRTLDYDLKSSKELVERAPVLLLEGIDAETANTYKLQLEQLEGVRVEFRNMVFAAPEELLEEETVTDSVVEEVINVAEEPVEVSAEPIAERKTKEESDEGIGEHLFTYEENKRRFKFEMDKRFIFLEAQTKYDGTEAFNKFKECENKLDDLEEKFLDYVVKHIYKTIDWKDLGYEDKMSKEDFVKSFAPRCGWYFNNDRSYCVRFITDVFFFKEVVVYIGENDKIIKSAIEDMET